MMEPLTVLVVDDNEVQRYAMRKLLGQCGFKTDSADSGRETLRRAVEKPDVIVLDLNLPDLDGFQVCRLLRADPNTSDIPVVLYSSVSQSGAPVNHAFELGVPFLFLPVLPAEITSVIHGTVVRRHNL